MRAAAEGDAEGVKKLLEAKPGLARSSGFSSPLHIAAAGGHSEVCVEINQPRIDLSIIVLKL